MFEALKKIYKKIKELNHSVDKYNKDTVIQSLPSVAYVNRAKKLIGEKKFNEAQEVLKSALDLSSQDSLVYKYLGKIREHYADFENAVLFYRTSAKLNPNDKEIWLRLGMSLMYSEHLNEALIAFENANKRVPFNTDIYTGWGMTYMKQKKYALAKDKFNTAARISKYNFSAILLSAVMEKRLNEFKSAEEKLRFLVKVAPNEGSLYEYAHLKLLQNNYDEAEIYSYKTLEYNKQMLPVYFLLSEIYSIKRDFAKTETIYKTALENGLDCSSLHFEQGKSYVRLLELQKAKEQFNFALEQEKDFVEAKIGLALINAYEGNFEPAEEFLQKYADNVYIMEVVGLKYLFEENYKQAIEIFKKALQKDCNQTYLYYNLACAYKGLNIQDKVREYFDKFIEKNPKYVKGLFDYANWLIEISDFEDARRKLEKALKTEPDNVDILNKLFFVQYTLVRKNVSEYNVKEAISVSNKVKELGKFDYYPELQELESILKDLQGR